MITAKQMHDIFMEESGNPANFPTDLVNQRGDKHPMWEAMAKRIILIQRTTRLRHKIDGSRVQSCIFCPVCNKVIPLDEVEPA